MNHSIKRIFLLTFHILSIIDSNHGQVESSLDTQPLEPCYKCPPVIIFLQVMFGTKGQREEEQDRAEIWQQWQKMRMKLIFEFKNFDRS